MLTRAELLRLAEWCRARGFVFLPGRTTGGAPSLLLERRGRGADAMLLVVAAGERRLLDAAGQELASASEVPALLDAVDAGVGDVAPVATLPLRRPAGGAARRAA